MDAARKTLIKEDVKALNAKLNELKLAIADTRRKSNEAIRLIELTLERLGFSLDGH